MSMYYLVGSGYNQLARCVTTPDASTGLSVADDVSVLYNGRADEPYIFSGNVEIDIDWNQTVNGDFATAFSGGHPGTGWGAVGTPACTKVSNAMQIAGASGDHYEYFDLSCSAGEVLTVSAFATPPTGAGGFSKIIVRNLETNATLNGAGVWVPATTGAAIWHYLPAALGGALLTTPFTVEPYSTCLEDRVVLRFEFYGGPGSGPTYPTYDDFFVWPRINFAHVHGHNIPPGATLAYCSSAFVTPTVVAHTFTVKQPSFYATFTDQDYRYGRLLLTANPPDGRNVYMWQVTFGQYQTARRSQDNGFSASLVDTQDRASSDTGPIQAYLRTARGRRMVDLAFKHTSAADKAEALEIMERSRNGALPSIIVTDSTDSSSGVLCQMPPTFKLSHIVTSLYASSVTLDEFAFRNVVE